MPQVVAGRASHTISRQCLDRADAEQWVAKLIQKEIRPVTIDGRPFDPTAQTGGSDPRQEPEAS